MFVPCGGGVNLTAFHFETKRRRSYNLGSGDYIIQVGAVAVCVGCLCSVLDRGRIEAWRLR